MSSFVTFEKSALRAIRTILGVTGAFALIIGLLILIWPGKTAAVVAGIVAVYAIITGLLYITAGVFSKGAGGWSRVGHVALGVLFVVAGILAFSNLTLTTASLALFVGIMVGLLWIFEGVVALTTVGDSSSKVVSTLFAIVSILAGVLLLFSPLFGAVILWWLLGVALVVLGVVNIVRALAFGRGAARSSRNLS